MVRICLVAAALCTFAAALAVDNNFDDGNDATTFSEGQALDGGLEQGFYPASARSEAVPEDGRLRLQLDDYQVIFKGEQPSSFPSAIGYPFGRQNIDNDGLSIAQSYLLSTVSSSIDDVIWGLTLDSDGYATMPQDIAPVPEAHEWAMMMAGLGVVGFVARRRKR